MRGTTGVNQMGTIICQDCQRVIDTFEAEKVTVYYGVCKQEDCKKSSTDAA